MSFAKFNPGVVLMDPAFVVINGYPLLIMSGPVLVWHLRFVR
jgi:hypothetical protein